MKTFFNWLAKLSFREKVLFYLALILVGGVLIDKLIFQPFFNDLQKIDSEIAAVSNDLSSDYNYASPENKKLVLKEFDVYSQFFLTAQPSSATELSKRVQEMAIKSNVAIDKIAPLTSRDSLRKIALQLDCVGDRKNLLDFIYSLSTSDIFLRLDKITLTPKKEDFATTIILSQIPLQTD